VTLLNRKRGATGNTKYAYVKEPYYVYSTIMSPENLGVFQLMKEVTFLENSGVLQLVERVTYLCD